MKISKFDIGLGIGVLFLLLAVLPNVFAREEWIEKNVQPLTHYQNSSNASISAGFTAPGTSNGIEFTGAYIPAPSFGEIHLPQEVKESVLKEMTGIYAEIQPEKISNLPKFALVSEPAVQEAFLNIPEQHIRHISSSALDYERAPEGMRFYYQNFHQESIGHGWLIPEQNLRGKIIRFHYSGYMPASMKISFMQNMAGARAVYDIPFERWEKENFFDCLIPDAKVFEETAMVRFEIARQMKGHLAGDFTIHRAEVLNFDDVQKVIPYRDGRYFNRPHANDDFIQPFPLERIL